jgi:hypothetical protein
MGPSECGPGERCGIGRPLPCCRGLRDHPGDSFCRKGLIPLKGGVMPAPRKYPQELRERSVWLVVEAMAEDRPVTS